MKMRNCSIGSRNVGEGSPVFITFEAGPTHSGIESAKHLIDIANKSGADAIKFQIFDVDRLVNDKSQPFTYSVLSPDRSGEEISVTEPLYDILKRRCLPIDSWKSVIQYAKKNDLLVFATVCFVDDVTLFKDLGVDSIKIASADCDFYPLLRAAAESGLPIQIDTGSSTIDEIKAAVNFMRSFAACGDLIIHHCPSGYPARNDSIDLNMITTLLEVFDNIPIAFSDHTPDMDMDIAAIALGVQMVEKTITEDKYTQSVEHLFSLEPSECTDFVERIRFLESAFGRTNRYLSPQQLETRSLNRRSPYSLHDYPPGTPLSDIDVEFQRPCKGISSFYYLQNLHSKSLVLPISSGQCITEEILN